MDIPIVTTQKLSYSFGKQTVLDNISLEVPRGSIYGFLGPNVAGKTTTLRLILGLLQKRNCIINVFGNDLSSNRISVLKRTGSLIEQPSLYLHLNGRQNLQIFRLPYNSLKSRINEVLQIVGLSDAGNKKVRAYSLGMKQRLGIAIALLHDPELLILDEPVNGLDPNGIVEIRDLLKHLNKEYGKTIILSSHLLSEIEKTASNVAIIHKGKILFQNTMEELLHIQSDSSVIEIETGDNEKAIQVLQQTVPVTLRGNRILVRRQSKEQIASLNALLVKEGIQVFRLVLTQNDIENIFMQITSM
jgi:ABC-type multidrug transport system ATPase subunit